VEEFLMTDGTSEDGTPSSWTASRPSGVFQTKNNRLMINGAGEEGVFTSGIIDIYRKRVNLSLDLISEGELSSSDYVRVYKIVNGLPEFLLVERTGNQTTLATLSANGIIGVTLRLVVRAKVDGEQKFYYIDNLSVTEQPNHIGKEEVVTAELLQNYPNPFQTKTTIPYRLNEAIHVRLNIYNLLGQQVASLVDEYQSPGYYTIEWHSDNLKDKIGMGGIYFCRMETGNDPAQIRKLIRLR
jgi:hypothetical protein